MIGLELEPPAPIIARIDDLLHPLMLHYADGVAVLVDAANTRFNPWEGQLLNWPPEVEADLRRGGYLAVEPPDAELWCNCAD